MMKYRAYLMVVILVAVASTAAFLGLDHWVRGQINTQVSSRLEGAGSGLVSQIRLKAFKMIQDLSRYENDERLLSALKKLPLTTSGMSVEEARIALERCHQEANPVLLDVKQKIKMTTNLVLLTPEGTVVIRQPDHQRFGDSMKGIPAVAECTQGISRDGIYEIDGNPQLVAVVPVQNKRGNVAGCLMSFNRLGTTEVHVLKQASGFDVAIFLRKKLVASTLEPTIVDQLTPQLDSREIIWFGNPKESKPLFVDYKRKAYAAHAARLPSGTDMFHLVAIVPSTHFIAIHQKTQQVLLIGCGALLIFGLLLCFILSGTPEANEAERLRDAAAMLANGSASTIVVESYSGIYREIARHLAHIVGADTIPKAMTVPEPIPDLLGPSPSQNPPPISSEPSSPDRNLLDIENLLGRERVSPDTKTPAESQIDSTDGYLNFFQETESQAGFDTNANANQAASTESEPNETLVKPTPIDLIKASSPSEPHPLANESFDEAHADSPPTLTGFESEEPVMEANPVEAHYREIFDQFVNTRKQCGEPTTGLSYERFSEKLRTNETDLKTRYKCNSVKFHVYVKNGKAALKASPIR